MCPTRTCGTDNDFDLVVLGTIGRLAAAHQETGRAGTTGTHETISHNAQHCACKLALMKEIALIHPTPKPTTDI